MFKNEREAKRTCYGTLNLCTLGRRRHHTNGKEMARLRFMSDKRVWYSGNWLKIQLVCLIWLIYVDCVENLLINKKNKTRITILPELTQAAPFSGSKKERNNSKIVWFNVWFQLIVILSILVHEMQGRTFWKADKIVLSIIVFLHFMYQYWPSYGIRFQVKRVIALNSACCEVK